MKTFLESIAWGFLGALLFYSTQIFWQWFKKQVAR